jgi:hypothetical protein
MDRGIKKHIIEILSDGIPRSASEIINEFYNRFPDCKVKYKVIRVTLSKEAYGDYPQWLCNSLGQYFIPKN